MSRVARIAGGSTLIVAGTAMLVLPGPGLLTIAAGVAMLSKDVAWANKLLERTGRRAAAPDQDEPDQAGG